MKKPRQYGAFNSGDDGIRTHVPVTRQLDFESSSLWPLRYVSIVTDSVIIPVCGSFVKGGLGRQVIGDVSSLQFTWQISAPEEKNLCAFP